MLLCLKINIQDAVGETSNKHATISAKNLNVCVTRWTVKGQNIYAIVKNYFALVLLFCTLILNTKQKSSLDQDKVRGIIGIIKYLQTWDLLWG